MCLYHACQNFHETFPRPQPMAVMSITIHWKEVYTEPLELHVYKSFPFLIPIITDFFNVKYISCCLLNLPIK